VVVYLAAQPRIHDMPPATMAVVRLDGDSDIVAKPAVAALRSVVTILGGAQGSLRVRRAEDGVGPITWALPVAAAVDELPQLAPGCRFAVETWDHGTVGEILHEGPAATLQGSIDVLTAHITARGHHIVGPREEEYLSEPDALLPRIVVRYPVEPIG
jgi:hypothetical protein